MRRLTPLLMMTLTLAASADTIVLRNGDRFEGRVESKLGSATRIRRMAPNGRGTFVETIDSSRIAVIQPNPLPAGWPGSSAAAQPAKAVQTRPASTQPGDLETDDRRALLLAMARFKSEEYAASGLELTKLINGAEEPVRAAMSSLCREQAGRTLGQLAAEAHLKAALAGQATQAIRLKYVTEYELPDLLPRLAEAYKASLEQEPGAASTAPAPASQPEATPSPGTLARWMEQPGAYNGTSKAARALLAQAYYAHSLVSERLRLDPELRRDSALRARLVDDKGKLTRLARVLDARSRGLPTPAEREARLADFERMRREFFHQQMINMQRQELMGNAEAWRAAQKIEQARQGGLAAEQDSTVPDRLSPQQPGSQGPTANPDANPAAPPAGNP